MTQYIRKDILMSQLNIELSNLRKAESEGYINEFGKGKLEGLEGIADFILNYCDSEVDLDRVIDKWIDDAAITHEDCSITDVINTAKHFFELGLKVQKGGAE